MKENDMTVCNKFLLTGMVQLFKRHLPFEFLLHKNLTVEKTNIQNALFGRCSHFYFFKESSSFFFEIRCNESCSVISEVKMGKRRDQHLPYVASSLSFDFLTFFQAYCCQLQ